MSDLRTVLRIKSMAKAAADVPEGRRISPERGDEMGAAYDRLRTEARALHVRAGWGAAEDFDAMLPPIVGGRVGRRAITEQPAPVDAVARGERARVLLGQLAGWAEGHQEAFQVEEQMKTTAAARVAAEVEAARKFGFGDRDA